MISIDYNLALVNSTVDNIDEEQLDSDRLIQFSAIDIPMITADIINDILTSDNIIQPLDRMNAYLSCISHNMETIDSILSNNIDDNAILNLASMPENYMGVQHVLTLNSYTTNLTQTFTLLSSFADTSLRQLLPSNNNCQLNKNILKRKYNALLNTQNTYIEYNTNFILPTSIEANSAIIECSDLLYLIDMFIQRLKNTKKVIVKFTHKKTEVETRITLYGRTVQLINVEDDISTSQSGDRVSLTISPFSTKYTLGTTDDTLIDIIPTVKGYSTNEYSNEEGSTKIILNDYIYDVSSGAELLQSIPLTKNGTNGQFAVNLKIEKNNCFNLTLETIQSMFNIKQHEIISRKAILHAIDYIFQYWIDNMSILTYNIYTCHSNCHSNVIDSHFDVTSYENIDKTIQQSVSFFYTGGCGCSTKLTDSVDFARLLQKTSPADFELYQNNYGTEFTFVGDLSASFTYNRYNLNDSPTSIKIDDVEIFNNGYKQLTKHAIKDVKATQGKTSFRLVATSATKDDDKLNYFCLNGIIYASYRISRKITQD